MSEHQPARHWVTTINLEPVLLGVEGGFTQADHGQDTRLRRLRRGDAIACYSPRTATGRGRVLQQFTALGVVADDEPYRVDVGSELRPWRRRVDFETEVAAVLVRALLTMLQFVDHDERWGLPFRRGLWRWRRMTSGWSRERCGTRSPWHADRSWGRGRADAPGWSTRLAQCGHSIGSQAARMSLTHRRRRSVPDPVPGDPGPTASPLPDVRAVVVRRWGLRFVDVRLQADASCEVRLTLERHAQVLATGQGRRLRVPCRVLAGPAQVRVGVTDTNGATRSTLVGVHVPAR